jgi:hypothetical protein
MTLGLATLPVSAGVTPPREQPAADAERADSDAAPSPRVSANGSASANGDPNRIVTETRDLSVHAGRSPCQIMGLDAMCFQGREGPLLVTDVIGAAGCADRLFIGATESDTTQFGFHWLFEVPFSPITGARLLVRPGERLHYALVLRKQGLSTNSECQLTWSGFRP